MSTSHASTSRYVAVWIALLALTLLSFVLSRAHLGSLDVVLALLIATVKVLLVGLFFMHLAEERFSVGMVPAVSIFLVLLLIVFVVGDVATRHTFPPAPLPHIEEPS